MSAKCEGSGTRLYMPVDNPKRSLWYATIARCNHCGRLVCLTVQGRLYRHNTTGRESSWVKWVQVRMT